MTGPRFMMASLLGIPLLLAGCGALTAQVVSIPMVIAQNKSFDLAGKLVDPGGRPLQDVIMHVGGLHAKWDPGHGYMEQIDSHYQVGPDFHIQQRAVGLTLTFSKPGYESLVVRIYHERFGFGHGLWGTYPLKDPLTIILHPDVPPQPDGLRHVTDQIVSNQEILLPRGRSTTEGVATRQWAIDLDAFAGGQEWWDYMITTGQPLRENAFYFTSEKSLDKREQLTLHLTSRDGGFVRFTPQPTDFPLAQMTQAPADGYQNDLVIPAVRVAEMITSRKDEQDDIYKHYEFYYFRANGNYGRLAIHRPYYWNADGFYFTFEIQRAGSRALPHVPGW